MRIESEEPLENCPKCNYGVITGARIIGVGNEAYQECECTKCHAIWIEIYKFSHVEMDDISDDGEK